MASPAQADIVRELYGRRDTLPDDKRAVVEELYNRMNSAGDQVGIRPASAMETVKSKLHRLVTDPIGTLTEKQHPEATDIDSSVPYWLINGTASGEGMAARTAKNFLNTPNKGKRVLGKVAGAASNVKTAYQDAAQSKGLAQDSQAAAKRFDEMTKAAPVKAPVAKAPAVPKTGSGRPLTQDEIDFQTAPKVAPDPTPSSAPEQELPDTPMSAPGRVRATPEAQTRADEIAALNRHADTLPLAQQTIQQGVSAKTLLALPDDARKAYMAKLGLANRSDATWRTYIGHVLRLEKLQK